LIERIWNVGVAAQAAGYATIRLLYLLAIKRIYSATCL
jgi:hypothetical protein